MTMIKITALMRELIGANLADGAPCLIGTSSKAGVPQISPKGSLNVLDDETLSFWERSHRSVARHLAENPRVVVFYRNQSKADVMPRGATWRFHGTATIHTSGAIRDKVWDITVPFERERDPEKKGFGVTIRIDKIEELSGTVIQSR
jgi:predicted pyridoxine 5'-phosphate oxidase superfamily flavin-nucleotide-binding protein